MKNLFLTVVFVLGTAISFAGNGFITKEKVHFTKEKVGPIHVTLSCGVEYDICNFTGTTTQLLNSILNSNNNICGTNFQMLP